MRCAGPRAKQGSKEVSSRDNRAILSEADERLPGEQTRLWISSGDII